MGRRRKGPIQLNRGATWYVRLWVPEKDRKAVGKSTLIRSLKTTDHAEALVRYGAAYRRLEAELEALLNSAPSLREQVEKGLEGPNELPTDKPLKQRELTEIQVGAFDPSDQAHQSVFNFYDRRPLNQHIALAGADEKTILQYLTC